jgi:hypothetical protein
MEYKHIEAVDKPPRKTGVQKYPWGEIQEGGGLFIPDFADKKRRPGDVKNNAERYCLRNDLNYEWEAFRMELDGEWGVVIQRPIETEGDKYE